ncbi:MAG: sodium-dependent transporter [Selenomonadaceae bacterium]|nr:sodium-dependent transporter [Selenomonadaceae bacterium]
MARENFGSRLGFLLVSAGCAIGIGNVWRFPFVAGEYGGGVFVLLYLVFLAIMGIPLLTMEFSVGRAGRKSTVGAYQALQKPGQWWHVHGWVAWIGLCVLMCYYTTVAGWMMAYFYKFAAGDFSYGMDAATIGGMFGAMLENPSEMMFWMGVNVFLGFGIVSFGIKNGVERVTKGMMLCLLILIMVLAGHSLTLEKAVEGMSFYLVPDFGRAFESGIGPILTAAMAQAFFTLSIGIGSMEIFGSYIAKDHSLVGESITICCLDTFVAIMAGVIIFPACFSFGVSPDAGPALIFVTLPNVFVNMEGGMIWGTLFFLFMTFASFSTVIAVFEGILAALLDNFPSLPRRITSIACAVGVFAFSIPCVLGFNEWSTLSWLPEGKVILDIEDFIVSNLMLPLGGLVFLMFCTTKLGWGYENYLKEVNIGNGMKMPTNSIIKWYLRIGVPVLVIFILIQGLT